MRKKTGIVIGVAVLFAALLATPALAHDHLFNAAHSPGVDQRDFANPVAGNPSGISGASAGPGTVPGLGDPNSGTAQGTPSVDLSLVSTRSGGHGQPQQ